MGHYRLDTRVMNRQLPISDEDLKRVCRKHQVRRLSLFGSVLKGTDGPDSDVDVLVEFDPAASPSLFDMADLEQDLSALLGGRRVDARTPRELSRYFRDEVMREAEAQFVSG